MVWRDAKVVYAPCDFCGRNETKFLFERPDGCRVVECMFCGLCYINPRPASEYISRIYDASYFCQGRPGAGIGYRDRFSDSAIAALFRYAGEYIDLVSKHVNLRGRRVLEIGCATGETCEAAFRRGACVEGCDISTAAVKVARERYPHITFTVGDVSVYGSRLKPQDVVIAFEVIEHVSSPSQWLREISRVLRPGGILALTTPNLQHGRQLGTEKWVGFNKSFEHLYFFSSDTLERLLYSTGFEMTTWHTTGDGSLRKVASGKVTFKRIRSILQCVGLLEPVRLFRDRIQRPKGWDWEERGSGHVLMAIALKRK